MNSKYRIVKTGRRGKRHIYVYGASDGNLDQAFCGKDVTEYSHYDSPVAESWTPGIEQPVCPTCLGHYVIGTKANITARVKGEN